jgi:hypothetical protein
MAINGYTALQAAERQHAGTATLIRNKKQETPLLGSRVVDESVDESMNGLVAKSELNGRTGTAVSFDHDKARSNSDTSSSLMIKPCNLLPTTVCSVALYVACSFHICMHYQGSLDGIILLQASTEKKTTKQQEDADRAMKELLEQAALKTEVEVEEERVTAEAEKEGMIQEEEMNVYKKARMMIEEEERKKWEEVLAAQREIAEK